MESSIGFREGGGVIDRLQLQAQTDHQASTSCDSWHVWTTWCVVSLQHTSYNINVHEETSPHILPTIHPVTVNGGCGHQQAGAACICLNTALDSIYTSAAHTVHAHISSWMDVWNTLYVFTRLICYITQSCAIETLIKQKSEYKHLLCCCGTRPEGEKERKWEGSRTWRVQMSRFLRSSF